MVFAQKSKLNSHVRVCVCVCISRQVDERTHCALYVSILYASPPLLSLSLSRERRVESTNASMHLFFYASCRL